LPLKLKKHEYEPPEQGLLMNLSQPCLIKSNYYLGDKVKKTKNRIWLTVTDIFAKDKIEPFSQTLKLTSINNWFDFYSIHSIEKSCFPLLCGTDSTEEQQHSFIFLRNAILIAYLSFPLEKLTMTEVYYALKLELKDCVAVYEFLERFSLINNQVKKISLFFL
jgi:hypothetical protein